MNSETEQNPAQRTPEQVFAARYHPMRERLHELYPAAFTGRGQPPVPLKLGLREDIFSEPAHGFGRTKMRWFLKVWTRREKYLQVIAAGGNRHGLDGSIVGSVTAEEQAHAKKVLTHRATRKKTARRSPSCPKADADPTQSAALQTVVAPELQVAQLS